MSELNERSELTNVTEFDTYFFSGDESEDELLELSEKSGIPERLIKMFSLNNKRETEIENKVGIKVGIEERKKQFEDKPLVDNKYVLNIDEFGVRIDLVKAWEYCKTLYNKSTNEIKTPPASFILRLTNLLPSKYSKNIEQEISDMRLEYYEALSKKKINRAKVIVVSYYLGFSWSVVMWFSDKVKQVIGIIPKAE